ncbi:hypothetical protein LSAT2_000996 [Lamellibrachia satsuma]|nr:hypothetical protein LSAT2_000996 [Lamellibrachia satsuma]
MNERTTLIVRRSGNPPPMSPTKETPKWPLVTKDTVDMERKTNNSKATHQAVIDRTRHKEPTQRVEVPEKPRRNTNDALLTKRERSAAALGRDRKNSVPKQQREIYCPELRRVAKNGEVKMTNKKKQKKTPPPPTTTKHKHSAVK